MLSTRMAIFRVVAAPLGFLAGQWLEHMPFPLNYQLLFATAFFAGLGSIACLSRLKVPDAAQKKMDAKREVSLREILPMVKSTPAFRNFALAALVFRLGIGLPQALFPIYRVRTLGSSDAWLGTLMMVQRLVGMVTFFALNPLLSRAKFRRWLWIGPVGLALFPLTTALAQTPQMLLIPAFVVGTFGAGTNIFLKEALFQSSPEGDRPTFVAVNTFVSKLTRFVGPMLGTLLAGVTSMGTALVIAACVRALGGLLFWRLGVAKGRAE
jgi:MFS-type transporter involved in bile tolerance (Atg22 family)